MPEPNPFGLYTGDVHIRWIKTLGGEDRDMELEVHFSYTDPAAMEWTAFSGAIINGASIPDWLWATVGSPFVGNYRRASVIRDAFCDEEYGRTEPANETHTMFYYAMRADGVPHKKASLMFSAVWLFGPWWDMSKGRATTRAIREPTKREINEFYKYVDKAAKNVSSPRDIISNMKFNSSQSNKRFIQGLQVRGLPAK